MNRRLWALFITPVLVMSFLVLSIPSASAFGGEVLGCSVDSDTWTANACDGGGDASVANVIHFAPHNLSGSYTVQWTVVNKYGAVVTASCSSTQVSNCIWGGCTASSLSCDIGARSAAQDKTFTATLQLTQSGQTRTLQAQALIFKDSGLVCCA